MPSNKKSDLVACEMALPRANGVTVAIRGYNCEGFIADAVSSALLQTWRPLEVIVYDDGSTDDTYGAAQAALRMAPVDVSVKLLRGAVNVGHGTALTRIVEASSGQWIMIADGDDCSSPERADRCMAAAYEAGSACVLVTCLAADFAAQGINLKKQIVKANPREMRQFGFRGGGGLPGGIALLRRDVIEFADLRRVRLNEDRVLGLRASFLGTCVEIDEILVRRRLHNSNTSLFASSRRTSAERFVALTAVERDLQRLVALNTIKKQEYQCLMVGLKNERKAIKLGRIVGSKKLRLVLFGIVELMRNGERFRNIARQRLNHRENRLLSLYRKIRYGGLAQRVAVLLSIGRRDAAE